jgi:transcriptional regulator of acetoin/glycerol metabolism
VEIRLHQLIQTLLLIIHRDEILRLHLACIANKKDHKELLEEREMLNGEVGKGKQNLTKQLHEVELKIKKQLVIIEDKKKTIESSKVIGDPGAISSLASAENVLKGQLESAEDIRGRLKSGALSPDAQERLLDIKVRKDKKIEFS